MTMLVLPEDLNKKCRILEKWQHFFIFHMLSCTLLELCGCISINIEIASLPDKV